VFFARRGLHPEEPCDGMSTDSWDGYQHSRKRITQGWITHKVRNPVVLTGDVHRHWANDLHLDFDKPGKPVGTELVTTSITSGGDEKPGGMNTKAEPHLRFVGRERGYVRCKLTLEKLTASFIGVSSVTEPNPAKVTSSVVAKHVIEVGRPGIKEP
jgi:alkaline phosphatase D